MKKLHISDNTTKKEYRYLVLQLRNLTFFIMLLELGVVLLGNIVITSNKSLHYPIELLCLIGFYAGLTISVLLSFFVIIRGLYLVFPYFTYKIERNKFLCKFAFIQYVDSDN